MMDSIGLWSGILFYELWKSLLVNAEKKNKALGMCDFYRF